MAKSISERDVMLVWETYVSNGGNAHETARTLHVTQGWVNRRLEKARKFFEDRAHGETRTHLGSFMKPEFEVNAGY